eukprot:TRINITY_DN45_c0_g3_i3.p2 TRINITY_DN45_c0_g3~~TRINITY_DN45_c0_g3_i3.p2  ORF type:complete len:249 (+),score=100.75 TRINITY_DN45_c0_g3_i3:169-915(+)
MSRTVFLICVVIALSMLVNTAQSNLVMGYWGIRGRAEPVRLLIALSGLEYTQKNYGDPKEWFGKDKASLNDPFPNLPYIKDEDFSISETVAVAQYIALKANKPELYGGKNNEDRVTFITLRGVLLDAKGVLMGLKWDNGDPTVIYTARKAIKDKIIPTLRKISTFLGDKEFLLGYVSFIDCQLYDLLTWAIGLKPNTLQNLKNIQGFYTRFRNLPQIKAYRKSNNYIRKPFISKIFQGRQTFKIALES